MIDAIFYFIIYIISNIIKFIIVGGFILFILLLPFLLKGGWLLFIPYSMFAVALIVAIIKGNDGEVK